MRTTLNIENELIEKASKLTGIKEKTSLVRLGLEALISKEFSGDSSACGLVHQAQRAPLDTTS